MARTMRLLAILLLVVLAGPVRVACAQTTAPPVQSAERC